MFPAVRRLRGLPPPAVVLLAAVLAVACHSDSLTGPGPQPEVAGVVVTALRQLLAPGDTLQLTAQVMDSAGRVLPTEPVSWSSSDPGVIQVDGQGLATAASVGKAIITASSGSHSGTVSLEVGASVLCPCTKVIDSTAMTLTSRDDSTGVYVFQILRGPPPDVDSGSILVGAEGEGYIRRVQHASLAGDVLTVQTTQAYVEEAVEEGGFSTTAFSDSTEGVPAPGGGAWLGPWKTVYMAPGVGLNRAGLCCTLDGLSLSFKVTPSQSVPVSGTVNFTINQGDIDFSPRTQMVTKVHLGKLTKFEHVLRGNLALNVDKYTLSIALTGSTTLTPLTKESQNFIIQQRPYATFIGPMPVLVIFTKKISLDITPSVSVSSSFTGSFHSSLGIEAGARWTDPGGWKPVFGASKSVSVTAPQWASNVEGTAAVKIAVVPEFNILLYGVVGPFINLEPYANASASAVVGLSGITPSSLDWETAIDLGLNLNGGAKLSVMGRKDLFTFGYTIPLIKPYRLKRNFSDGPLTVRTITAGQDIPDSLGVQLRPAFVDKLPPLGRDLGPDSVDRTIASNGTLMLDSIRSGTSYPHRLALTRIAGNCYDSLPNPDTISIASHATINRFGGTATDTLFRVNCIPLGDLDIQTSVTGPSPPPRFRAILLRRDTVGVGRADTPDTVGIPGGHTPPDTVLEGFIPVNPRRGGTGRLDATLETSRRNCAVARPSTSQLVIQSGDTVSAQYLVTCVPLGSIRVSAATFDPDPPPGQSSLVYLPQVVPLAAQDSVAFPPDSLAAGDSTMVDSLVPLYNASGAPGKYTTQLTGAPNRCSDPQSLARAVTVLPGDTAIAAYDVHCVDRLHVATITTGPGTDPNGYGIAILHPNGTVDTLPSGVNDTVHVAGLAPGAHILQLTDVESSCIAPPADTVMVSATDSTLARFQVSCPAPPPPAGLTATSVTTSQIDLAWHPAGPDSVIAAYRLYRNGALYDSTTDTTFSDTGLAPYTQFTYQVSSVNHAGLEGARSGPLTVRTLDATPPTTPQNLSAVAAGGFQADLTWTAATDPETGIARYRIYRGGVLIDSTTGTSYTDTSLAPGTTYSWEVSAVNGAGLEGPHSAPATATTASLTTTGELRVTVITTGVVPQAPFEVVLEGPESLSGPVAPNGSAIFTALTPGSYSVLLRGTPETCTIAEPNPRTVGVVTGQQAQTTFGVTCQ